jgi:hypothetical protein
MDFSLIANVAAGAWLAGVLSAWACIIFAALHPKNTGKMKTLPGFIFVSLLAIPLWPMAIAAVLNELFMQFHPLMAKDEV